MARTTPFGPQSKVYWNTICFPGVDTDKRQNEEKAGNPSGDDKPTLTKQVWKYKKLDSDTWVTFGDGHQNILRRFYTADSYTDHKGRILNGGVIPRNPNTSYTVYYHKETSEWRMGKFEQLDHRDDDRKVKFEYVPIPAEEAQFASILSGQSEDDEKGAEAAAGSDDDNCVICMVEKATHAVVPCGHKSLCTNCAATLTSSQVKRLCPICREPIVMTMKIFGRRRLYSGTKTHRAVLEKLRRTTSESTSPAVLRNCDEQTLID